MNPQTNPTPNQPQAPVPPQAPDAPLAAPQFAQPAAPTASGAQLPPVQSQAPVQPQTQLPQPPAAPGFAPSAPGTVTPVQGTIVTPGQPAPGAVSQPLVGNVQLAQANLNQYGQPAAVATPSNQPAAPKVADNPISTQSTLLFSELRDGIVIMKDGTFRAVVACQSINFDLMSEQEREGVEYSYQNFLNSLTFTIQILVRSQKIDISPYIDKLVKLRRNNDNMLLGVLMDDYINFVDVLSQEANIMDKSFFIVIPYYGSEDIERAMEQTKNFFKTFSRSKTPVVTRINREVYNKAIDELNNRVESVISGLYQIGIQSVRLNTKELSELFYNFNNPDTAVREPLVDFTKVATMYVKKGTKEQQ